VVGRLVLDGTGVPASLGGCGRIGDCGGDEGGVLLDWPDTGADDPLAAGGWVGGGAPVAVVAPVSPARGCPVTAVEHPASTVSAASSAAPRLVARRLRVVIVTAAP